jgi:hypothetical protein
LRTLRPIAHFGRRSFRLPNKIAIYRDFSDFLIADRIGGTIELIPHLFGATNRYPVGQRGLYYHWRVGADGKRRRGKPWAVA